MSRCISVKNVVFSKPLQYESMHAPYVSIHKPEISKKNQILGQPTSCIFFINFQDESIQMMNIKVEEDHLIFQMAPVPTQIVT